MEVGKTCYFLLNYAREAIREYLERRGVKVVSCYFLLNYASNRRSRGCWLNFTTCYFLLNYAEAEVVSYVRHNATVTCYFLLNYARQCSTL